MASAIETKGGIKVEPAPAPSPLKARLVRVRDALTAGLIERDIPIRLAFLAALAGEHVLLIGPPGTAKSELARRLRLAFTGQTYFERLLTRFSVPEELFGPLSIKALEEDRYQRQIDGYLPTASVAFLDEIFKANSAILNALLTLLNEREFDNGTQRISTPLVSVVGASNELPQEEELLALYDRFLVRHHVGPVSDEGFERLLALRGQTGASVAEADRLTPEDIAGIKAAALRVAVPAEVASLLKAMRAFCRDKGIPVSDRRWRKALFLLQVAAHTDGREAVSVWDCWLLQHCLWHKPEDREALATWYQERAGAASPREPERFAKVAAAWEQRLQEDQNRKVEKRNEEGQVLYLRPDGQETTESTWSRNHWDNPKPLDPVYMPVPFSEAHIRGRMDGVQAVEREVQTYVDRANADCQAAEGAIRGHLWLDPSFAAPAIRGLQDHIARAKSVLERLDKASVGFECLPLEGEMDSARPEVRPEPEHRFAVGDRVIWYSPEGPRSGEVKSLGPRSLRVDCDDGALCVVPVEQLVSESAQDDDSGFFGKYSIG